MYATASSFYKNVGSVDQIQIVRPIWQVLLLAEGFWALGIFSLEIFASN